MSDDEGWHKVQIFGLWVWQVPADLDVERLDQMPGEKWKYVNMRGGSGEEQGHDLRRFMSTVVGSKRGIFIGAIGRGDRWTDVIKMDTRGRR